jgi:hypothetical protein
VTDDETVEYVASDPEGSAHVLRQLEMIGYKYDVPVEEMNHAERYVLIMNIYANMKRRDEMQ